MFVFMFFFKFVIFYVGFLCLFFDVLCDFFLCWFIFSFFWGLSWIFIDFVILLCVMVGMLEVLKVVLFEFNVVGKSVFEEYVGVEEENI